MKNPSDKKIEELITALNMQYDILADIYDDKLPTIIQTLNQTRAITADITRQVVLLSEAKRDNPCQQ